MAWPPTFNLATNSIGKAGSLPSVLAFGTDGIFTGIIVKTIRSSQMIEEIKIEQGSGLTATDILIDDGDEVEIVCIDDRGYSWPLAGGVVTVVNPQPSGLSPSTETYQVINNNFSSARKTDGERTILAKRYSIVSPVQM